MPRWYELEKHSQSVREWHPQNSQEICDSKTADTTPVWWLCQKGHSYKERLSAKINGGKNCPVCRQEIRLAEKGESLADRYPELRGYRAKYGFRAEDLLASATSSLLCPEGHQFTIWEGDYRGCGRCLYGAEIDALAEGFEPGEVFPSPREYPGSASEDRLRSFLEDEGLGLLAPNTAIKLADRFFNWMFAVPDIILEDVRLAVEYDDAATHTNRQEQDRLKNKLLEDVGWQVVRIRTHGLPPINSCDIQTGSGPTRYAAKKIAQMAAALPRDTVPKFPGN